MKPSTTRLQQIPTSLLACLVRSQPLRRHLHQQSTAKYIPSPTPFVPDSKTFLTLIGRNLSQHAAKLPTWDSLFSLTSIQLRKLGIEPARTRRYLLWWRDRFRKGHFGVGGDLKNVKDSVGHVRVVELAEKRVSKTLAGPQVTKKMIVNIPPDAPIQESKLQELGNISGLKVVGAHTISGPFVEPVKGTGGSMATIKVQEGMWEQRRGQKIDGGERRKVQVRRKRKLEELRNAKK
ncbi:MAG: hypothetical protein Q9220_002374 [cf. Caloplaca sp. 1 TL-2023]